MISSWRRRVARKEQLLGEEEGTIEMELAVPTHFRCPISLDLMKDPVTLSTGITYDRHSIETWIEGGNQTCPITIQPLRSLEPIPNHVIRRMIQDWCVQNQSHGVERIPTPRIPVTSMEVEEILSNVSAASKREDQDSCRQMVGKIKKLVKESERNKKRFAANGTGTAMAVAFEAFSSSSGVVDDKNLVVLEEILSVLTSMMFPLDGEAKAHLVSPRSLNSMVWILKLGGLSGRRNSVLALKEIVSSDKGKAEFVAEVDGALEALHKLIKEPICPTATETSLLVAYHITTLNNYVRTDTRLVQMGWIELMLEIIIDSDQSVCEKALGVLNNLCNNDKGREVACENSLAAPVLVKKLLRVSDLATEFSVSVLWKLGKGEKREDGEGFLFEALQVGAFQKLLLLLQVGCGERTKEKATELLKLLNPHRESWLECIDSQDFKDLKRPF